MKNEAYNVSLIKSGVIGGLMYLKDTEAVFCTNKLTVPSEIRRLHLPLGDIKSVEKAPYHTVLITLHSGASYRFLVFSREKLLGRINELI